MEALIIKKRKIGEGYPTYVIAEAGSNHNRNYSQAKKLIDIAASAKADAVKFQTYSAETLYSKKTTLPSYLQGRTGGKSVWQVIKDLEMPREWQKKLAAYAKSLGLIFLSTPFDYQAIKELEEINIPLYKIASFEIVDLPFIKEIARTKKPIILSTGMASLGDIEDALNAIRQTSSSSVALLHCAINYPPKFADLNLRAMQTLKQAFQVPVGYSDHTMSVAVPSVCVALGASIIEKHFTLDRKLTGPDHKFALVPEQLKEMVRLIRETEASLGSCSKILPVAEKNLYQLGRRSIIAKKKIVRGQIIKKSDLIIKRPGYGIPPKFLEVVVGRKAKRNFQEDEVIIWKDI